MPCSPFRFCILKFDAIYFYQHPSYSPDFGLPNDIALIQLTQRVNVTGHYIRTACFPQDDDVFSDVDYCYISGWGYTQGKPLFNCVALSKEDLSYPDVK